VLLARLAAALAGESSPRQAALLNEALGEIGASARSTGLPVEQMVVMLREASARAAHRTETERAARYSEALLRLLAVYFDEAAR
jgi:hypothetical protein